MDNTDERTTSDKIRTRNWNPAGSVGQIGSHFQRVHHVKLLISRNDCGMGCDESCGFAVGALVSGANILAVSKASAVSTAPNVPSNLSLALADLDGEFLHCARHHPN